MASLPLSTRDQFIEESPIRKLAPYAQAAKKEGVRVFHLNIGQPDIHTPELMVERYAQAPDIIAYGPSNGLESYRKRLADYYRTYDIAIDPDEIFVTTGGSEALLFAMMAALSPGDEVIVIEPYYTNYNGFAAMAGVRLVPVSASIEDGFKLPSLDALESALSEKTRAVIITNPGNPTGAIFPREMLETLAAFVKKHNLYLISDEVYREFVYGEEEAVSVLSLPGLEEHAIMADSVSKRFSACGARIGALVTRNRRLLSLVLKFGQARLCPPTVEQMAAESALDTPPEYLESVVAEYRKRRDLAFRRLDAIDGVVVKKPEGAFYMMVELPIDDCERFAVWLLQEYRYRGATVMLAPGSGFYASEGLGKKQVRLAYVLKQEDLEQAIEIIEQALRVYPGRES